ncbi:hypothetical protein D3C73_1008460 [compost metagenome]
MGAALVFHFAVGTASVNHENNLFKSAKVAFIHVHQFYTPALRISISRIHSVQISRKQRSLVSACSSAYFNDYVFIIIRIFRQQQYPDGLLQLLLTLGQIIDFQFNHFTHFIVQLLSLHSFCCLKLLDNILIFGVRLKSRL